ncbi:MAG: Gfo/Idh/MocA family oxidoreductase [Chloroflexota bacterium]|nr:Gfo/Idh/MocA family oxidoreductase [Chloroflexota bacterium]
MAEKTRWGILSTGSIAGIFATGLKELPDAEIVAVGSRSQDSADAFGARFNIPRRYASYEDLANDPEVDAIYIGTPHPMHKDSALLCLNAGKAVLCEKPFMLNAGETRTVIQTARERGVFLMEAMWTRFIPATTKVRELIASGAIGDVRLMTVDFGFRATFDPKHRLFAPELGGGSLLDIGVYDLALASLVFGRAPIHVVADADKGATGVDEQMAAILRYDDGALAVLTSAVRTDTPQEAVINGTHGRIRIHSQFWRPTRLTVTIPNEPERVYDIPYAGNGYHYEAAEVARCLREGLTESPTMPLDETLAIMETMDTIRAAFGLVYPRE